ncbi:MAG TPA: MYXO-CTERM-anchored inactivated metalloprotease [Hyalangium sp.]|nr:MYXO-CTERM-anchored inactivated metalloprotease [Hyalangium sp.]
MSLNRLPLLVSLAVLLPFSNAQAQAYERQRVQPNGPSLCLGSRTFTYALATTAGRPMAAERAAVVAAFNAWSEAASTCSDLVFKQAADVPNGTQPPYDGKTLVTFRKVKCADVVPSSDACLNNSTCGDKYDCWEHPPSNVVQALVTYEVATGLIAGTNIELNASLGTLTTVDSPPCPQGVVQPGCVAGDVQSLVTRSIGEALGLALVSRADSTLSSTLPWGDTQKRVIDPGTLQGLCELYPRGKPTPDCALPEPETPGDDDGCSAASSTPLLGALVLLLGIWRRRMPC